MSNTLLQYLGLTPRQNSLLDGAPMYQGGPQASNATPYFVPAPRTPVEYASRAIDPQTPNERMGVNVVRGFTESPASMAVRPIRAFHGSPQDFDVFDNARLFSGATEGRFVTPPPAAHYLTTSEQHAALYGNPLAFDVRAPLVRANAKAELARWARENGHRSAQDMINRYYDGDAYAALNADTFFADQLRAAKAQGKSGALVDFGDLTSRENGRHIPLGRVLMITDPAAAVRVR